MNSYTQRMADLTGAVQKTLDAYADRLRAEKMGLLESYVLEAAGTLMHKEIIEGISIDPETFEVSLHDADRNAIPRETLSKGEQQMLATSILWGLARTSGRPLPFMIDTPLARLDTEHRANLIERFLPLASHQTVVLSTNTEIGAADYARLLPYISRSYTIRYDPGAASTMVREGYFWDGNGLCPTDITRQPLPTPRRYGHYRNSRDCGIVCMPPASGVVRNRKTQSDPKDDAQAPPHGRRGRDRVRQADNAASDSRVSLQFFT